MEERNEKKKYTRKPARKGGGNTAGRNYLRESETERRKEMDTTKNRDEWDGN